MAYRADIRAAAVVVVSVAAIVWAAGPAQAQLATEPMNDHPNPFETINDHFELPAGRTWGSTSAVDIDPDGTSIWVGERCGANSCAESDLDPILKFDKDGNLLTSFGAGMFIFPHGIHVDRQGNVWVTDAQGPRGRGPAYEGKGHAVFKFNPDGELLLTLGRPGVAGDGSGPLLNEPNDVHVAPNGDIFVAEGHSGQGATASWDTVARIVKFDRQGNIIKSWGSIGTAPGQFRTPHGLAMDSRGRLFVADRGNVRIQIFDQDGNFIDQWKQFSRLSGIYIDADDNRLRRRLGVECHVQPRLAPRHPHRERGDRPHAVLHSGPGRRATGNDRRRGRGRGRRGQRLRRRGGSAAARQVRPPRAVVETPGSGATSVRHPDIRRSDGYSRARGISSTVIRSPSRTTITSAGWPTRSRSKANM